MNFQEISSQIKESVDRSRSSGDLGNSIGLLQELIGSTEHLIKGFGDEVKSIRNRYDSVFYDKFIGNRERNLEIIETLRGEILKVLNRILEDEFNKNVSAAKIPLKVFLSYSHVDVFWKNELLDHLCTMVKNKEISVWHDGLMIPGEEWDVEIKMALSKSDIIFFLLSSKAMASDYIWEEELTISLKRHKSGEAKIIPIFVRPCDIEGTIFAELQGLPKGKKWLSSKEYDLDTSLANIPTELRRIIKAWKS